MTKLITIQIPSEISSTDQVLLTAALQKIASQLKPSTVVFLAEMAGRPGADKKIEDKKTLIKSFL